jgi:hypothetical protein
VQVAVDTKAVKKFQHDFRIAKAEAEALWLSRKHHHSIATCGGPGIKVGKVLGLRFLTAIYFLLRMTSHHRRLSRDIAQEKLLKLAKLGRYNARIIEYAMNRLKEGREEITMGVISLRLENLESRRIDDLSSQEHKGRLTVARELFQQGFQFRMLKQYREGKLSLGSLAKNLDISVGEAIDILAEFGIESSVAHRDSP